MSFKIVGNYEKLKAFFQQEYNLDCTESTLGTMMILAQEGSQPFVCDPNKSKEKINVFETFKRMNENDTKSGKATLMVSNYFHEGRYCRRGAIIGMGVDRDTYNRVAMGNGEYKTILLVYKNADFQAAEKELQDV